MSDLYMQSLWNFLLVIFCLILAWEFHTVDIDKTKLEYDKTSLQVDKKQLQKRLEIAERREKECVEKNDACQQQLKKFEVLKKTSKFNDDKLDYQADQMRRLELKKNHFRSLLNKTHQVEDEVQPVECAMEKKLDYAQTYIYVVEANILCLVCVIMYVLWNSKSDKSNDLTEEELKQILEPALMRVDSNGSVVVDYLSTGVIACNSLNMLLRGTGARKKLFRRKPQEEKRCWDAVTASIWNQVQFDDIESNMISTATFYPRSHDTAENNFDRNPCNKHGRFLDEYRALPE